MVLTHPWAKDHIFLLAKLAGEKKRTHAQRTHTHAHPPPPQRTMWEMHVRKLMAAVEK